MVIILLGMLLFASLHSYLAGRDIKESVRLRFGDRIYYSFYRIGYNIFSIITLAPVAWIVWTQGNIIWEIHENLSTIFSILQMIGTVGLIISILQIDFLRFLGVRQSYAYFRGNPLPLPDEKLTTGGLYKLVRHPLYFFSLISLWFVVTMTDTLLVFNIAATLYFIIGSGWEEKRLSATFGQIYLEYQNMVPWLVPFPRPDGSSDAVTQHKDSLAETVP